MLLADRDIEHQNRFRGIITPFRKEQLQPCSYDIRLGRFLLIEPRHPDGWYDKSVPVEDMGPTKRWDLRVAEYEIQKGEFLLAESLEKFNVPLGMCMHLHGKSTIGRQGMLIHATAGLGDPGWTGVLTLELALLSRKPLTLTEGMLIGQVTFEQLTRPSLGYGHYGNHYQNQAGVTPAALLDLDEGDFIVGEPQRELAPSTVRAEFRERSGK